MATAATQRPQEVPMSTPQPLPEYVQEKETTADLEWADLVTLDLSQFDEPGGQDRLAAQLKDAIHNIGFFYITNFGLSQAQVDRQFAIGREFFALPTEEKLPFKADLANGNYNGYRPLGSGEILPGKPDNIEMLNVFKYLPAFDRPRPAIIEEHREEVEAFQRHIAQVIVPKLLTLIAIILEVPAETLLRGHAYDDLSACHLRYMIYRHRTPEENAAYGGIYSKGHSDFGTLTLLFRQPVAALQVRVPDSQGGWRWVKPHADSITVNVADVLQFWTAGYLKSSIHRVVAPPPDQAHIDRLGLLYFLRPADDLKLKALESPLLKRLGLGGEEDEVAGGVKAGDWVRARVKGNQDRVPEGGFKEKAVVAGLKAKYYD